MRNGKTYAAALALASLVLAGSAEAQISRVFVSINGNDANVCSNIATPCRTFAGGVTQVDAQGEVIVIDSGSYAGGTITKSVKINVASGVVASSGLALTINPGGGGTVVVRGITLKALTPGSGTGINLMTGNLFVEQSVIDGWATGVGVAAATKIYLTDTTIRNNTTGVDVSVGAQVSVDNARFENNGTGFLASNGKTVMTRAVLSGNTTGVSASGASEVTMHKRQVANNGTGVSAGGGTARVSDSTVSGNTTGLSQTAGTLESFVNNQVGGNGTNTSGTITNVPLT
jgi:hypothetical protein